MKDLRRGISLVEILVSLVILAIVATMVTVVFLDQNRNWKTESDKAAVGMMAKGVLDEITHSARLTGGGLPINTGGIKVWGSGQERVTFVTNENSWVGRVMGGGTGSSYDHVAAKLTVAVDNADNFADSGYVLLNAWAPQSSSGGPYVLQPFTLGINERHKSGGSCVSDSLVLDASGLVARGWVLNTDVQVYSNASVTRIDSINYSMGHDTLYIKRNRKGPLVYAIGVDYLNIQYRHPGDNLWHDSLSPVAPANQIDQVRIHLVTRSIYPDSKLKTQDSTSRGYRYSTLEAEVTLRNDSLVNKGGNP